jgi:hypothetical protein
LCSSLAELIVVLQSNQVDSLFDGTRETTSIAAEVAQKSSKLACFEYKLSQSLPANFGLLDTSFTRQIGVKVD